MRRLVFPHLKFWLTSWAEQSFIVGVIVGESNIPNLSHLFLTPTWQITVPSARFVGC
jgi:hypothetical protein